jgi:hypothetical protein
VLRKDFEYRQRIEEVKNRYFCRVFQCAEASPFAPFEDKIHVLEHDFNSARLQPDLQETTPFGNNVGRV